MERKKRNAKKGNWIARRARVLRTLGDTSRVRLTVYRSAKHIYAQLDDPVSGRTLASVSTLGPGVLSDSGRTSKLEAAKRVGQAVAALAREKQIEKVVFNRNGFLYHGRIKALAEAAREAGLQF
ncbi:MAG TPA: 50S ribosomal protein L18 [Myxococcota bacterium]|nr:50S ribosomal protein L18 [Myxococcota bacterium]